MAWSLWMISIAIGIYKNTVQQQENKRRRKQLRFDESIGVKSGRSTPEMINKNAIGRQASRKRNSCPELFRWRLDWVDSICVHNGWLGYIKERVPFVPRAPLHLIWCPPCLQTYITKPAYIIYTVLYSTWSIWLWMCPSLSQNPPIRHPFNMRKLMQYNCYSGFARWKFNCNQTPSALDTRQSPPTFVTQSLQHCRGAYHQILNLHIKTAAAAAAAAAKSINIWYSCKFIIQHTTNPNRVPGSILAE